MSEGYSFLSDEIERVFKLPEDEESEQYVDILLGAYSNRRLVNFEGRNFVIDSVTIEHWLSEITGKVRYRAVTRQGHQS